MRVWPTWLTETQKKNKRSILQTIKKKKYLKNKTFFSRLFFATEKARSLTLALALVLDRPFLEQLEPFTVHWIE